MLSSLFFAIIISLAFLLLAVIFVRDNYESEESGGHFGSKNADRAAKEKTKSKGLSGEGVICSNAFT